MVKKDKAQRERDAAELAARKAASNPDPLAFKGLSGLAKVKAELDAREKAELAAQAEKARKEAEFRAKIGLAPARERPSSLAIHATRATPVAKPSGANTTSSARKTDAIEVWRPDLDAELFNAAMTGVKPLAPRKTPDRVGAASPRRAPSPMGAKARRAAAEGDVGLQVRWREDRTCEASRRGASFALEGLDRFATPQDTLDLHGLDATEARSRTVEFVRTRRARGLRVVEVVHGTGRHAPDGHCVLRDIAVAALSEVPGSREVEAFRSAPAGPSGSASLRIALRPLAR
jgi:DNA-nicking Smr family endonuclease